MPPHPMSMSATPGGRATQRAFLDRAAASIVARVTMAGATSIRVVYDDVGESLEFDACEVRPTGAFLPSELMFEHGATLDVQLTLPGLGAKLLHAQVVSVDLAGNTFGRPGMGIAFRGLANAERRALRKLALEGLDARH